MEVSKASIQKAVANNIISEQQGIALYNFFQEEKQHTPSFTFTHILYYLGGLIAISAMTLFMNLGWEQFGGAGIVFISMLYAGVGLKLANSFARKHLIIPAGICATFVVCLTPIAIYGELSPLRKSEQGHRATGALPRKTTREERSRIQRGIMCALRSGRRCWRNTRGEWNGGRRNGREHKASGRTRKRAR